MEKYIQEHLNSYGYSYDNQTLNNVNSLNKLSSDLLSIISSYLNESNNELTLHESIKLSDDEKSKFPFSIDEPFIYKIPDYESRRKIISDIVFGDNKYPYLTEEYNNKLEEMFKYYDYYFFSNLISYGLNKGSPLNNEKNKISFEFSNRLTSTGGTCLRDGICSYKIKISSNRINKLEPNNVNKIHINGLTPKNRIDGLQLIFEHELIHAVLSLYKNDLNGHNKLFQDIVLKLFGHTEFKHGISDHILNDNSHKNKYTKNDFEIGDMVYFMNGKGMKIRGKIIKINPKRAKVNSEDGKVWLVHYEYLIFLR